MILPPCPSFKWFIDSQISGKRSLIVLKILMRERENVCFSALTLRKLQDLCQAKSMLQSFYNTSRLDI